MIDIQSDFARYLKNRDMSERSIQTYVEVSGRMCRYIEQNFNAKFEDDAVKGYMISNWESSIQNLKITTKNQYLLIAKAFLKYLFLMQYVTVDMSDVLSKPKSLDRYYKIHPDERSEKVGYTLDEVKTMMNAARCSKINEKRTAAMIAALVSSGLRAAELCSLNVGDLKEDTVFVMVARKGTHGNKVKAALPFEARPIIDEYLQARVKDGEAVSDESPLFVTRKGSRMSPNTMWVDISRIQKKLGIHTGIHTFRHTALTAAAKSADPVTSRDFAGQKNIAVTNRYLHSTEAEIESAASAVANIFISNNKQTST